MRRHVEGVLRLGSDPIVGPRKGQPLGGEPGRVVQMDEVVDRAGMLRVVPGHPLGKSGGLAG